MAILFGLEATGYRLQNGGIDVLTQQGWSRVSDKKSEVVLQIIREKKIPEIVGDGTPNLPPVNRSLDRWKRVTGQTRMQSVNEPVTGSGGAWRYENE